MIKINNINNIEQSINTINCMDNLELMKQLSDESIDLIYCDILYNTGRKFKDYNDNLGTPQQAIQWYEPRLIEMKRILKQTGSIYLQCDYRLVHYLKVKMDEIFGYDNFKNDIVWCYKTRQFSKKYWNRKHDNILFYTKSNNWVFNYKEVLDAYSQTTIKKYKLKDDKGYYRLCGRGIKGSPIKSAKDIDSKWEITNPELVVRNYLKDGYPPSDYWNIDIVNQSAKERINYDTQKPKALIERIIKASSNENDIIADFFCGSGTTGAVAKELNRKYILCDINQNACNISNSRINNIKK